MPFHTCCENARIDGARKSSANRGCETQFAANHYKSKQKKMVEGSVMYFSTAEESFIILETWLVYSCILFTLT